MVILTCVKKEVRCHGLKSGARVQMGRTSGRMDESNTELSPSRLLFVSQVKPKVSVDVLYLRYLKLLIIRVYF